MCVDQSGMVQRTNVAAQRLFGVNFTSSESESGSVSIGIAFPEPFDTAHMTSFGSYAATGAGDFVNTSRLVVVAGSTGRAQLALLRIHEEFCADCSSKFICTSTGAHSAAHTWWCVCFVQRALLVGVQHHE